MDGLLPSSVFVGVPMKSKEFLLYVFYAETT